MGAADDLIADFGSVPVDLHCFQRMRFERGGIIYAQLYVPFAFAHGFHTVEACHALLSPSKLTVGEILDRIRAPRFPD